MTPTQSEVNEALSRIERDQQDFHALSIHNKQIARERIAEHRARSIDDITEARMNGGRAVWPTDEDSTLRFKRMVNSVDRYEKPFPWGVFCVLGLIAFCLIAYFFDW